MHRDASNDVGMEMARCHAGPATWDAEDVQRATVQSRSGLANTVVLVVLLAVAWESHYDTSKIYQVFSARNFGIQFGKACQSRFQSRNYVQ
jgi:hypothetical protein